MRALGQIVSKLINAGMSPVEIEATAIASIRTINAARCDPPLTDKELTATVYPAIKKWIQRGTDQSRARTSAQEDFRDIPAADQSAADQQQVIPDDNTMPDTLAAYIASGDYEKDEKIFVRYKDRQTGFPVLDAKLGSLYPGLILLGAITALGKTTFVLQLCDQLAERGDHVLYFSMEMSRLEMYTKSIAREMARESLSTARSAIQIRRGPDDLPTLRAMDQLKTRGILDHISVIQCDFSASVEYIREYVQEYIQKNNVVPVVVIDYLQAIPASDPRATDKQSMDHIVRELKKMQRAYSLVVLAISSLNRANYLTPVDYESFKESGDLEFTADMLWGLQLRCLKDPIFDKEGHIKEKRELVKAAMAAQPRAVDLVCLKNRNGPAKFSDSFDYNTQFDCFTELQGGSYGGGKTDNDW
jgi:replicative DNA helicase